MGFISFIFIFILVIVFMLILSGFSFLARIWNMITGRSRKKYDNQQYNRGSYEPEPRPTKITKDLGGVKDVEYEKVED